MRVLSRSLLSWLSVFSLAASFSQAACFAEEYRDDHGRLYRHARWHDEHLYQREDGHWYARRNGQWVVVLDARID